jgi:hypothetical protein
MGYQKKKPKYKQPKQYHLVITDITNYIDKMVKDKRDIDRNCFNDEIQRTLEVLNYELLRSDDENDKLMVYTIGIQLISMLIVQTSLFGRICIENETYVDGEKERLITLPRNEFPLFFKQGINKGQNVDNWDIHSLSKMKEWYKKNFKNKSLKEIMDDGNKKRKRKPLPYGKVKSDIRKIK